MILYVPPAVRSILSGAVGRLRGFGGTVASNPAVPVATTISINPSTAAFALGDTQQYTAVVRDQFGSPISATVSWSSNSGNVTISSSTGLATGAAYGAAIITATSGVLSTTAGATCQQPTLLAVITQPAGATTGSAFTTQPVIELRDASNNPDGESGRTVTVSVLSGSGTLSGLTSIVTDGSGRAVFTNLAITGTGAHTLSFASTGLTGVNSASFTVSAASSIGTLAGNAPGYANTATINFSQNVPTGNPNVDNPIVGASPWNAIYMAADGPIKDTDVTAPGSGPSTWRWHWAAGDYSSGGGHGFGNFFVNMRSVMGHDAVKIYASVVMKFSASWVKHPISNKWLNIDTNGGVIVLQWNEGNTDWFPMDELVAGGQYLTCNISNNAYVPDTWEQVEVLIDFTANTLKVWRNGTLVSSRTNYAWASSAMNTIGWNQFRGGGGEVLASSFEQIYDHVYVEFQ